MGARDEDFTLDDLVAHERGNLKLVAVVFVGALIYAIVQGRPPQLTAPDATPAPITSDAPR